RGVSDQEHASNLDRVLSVKPDLLIDDGAELSIASHLKGLRLVQTIIGACEETTTGVSRLRAMEREGRLKFPVIAVCGQIARHMPLASVSRPYACRRDTAFSLQS